MKTLTTILATALFLAVTATAASAQPYVIRDDATGGHATLIGTWDALTKTATLTQDVSDTITIVDGGITLDGAGHSLTGSGQTFGVKVTGGLADVTVRNLTIGGFQYAVFLDDGNVRGKIEGLTITDTSLILLDRTTRDSVVRGNKGGRIGLTLCDRCVVEDNTIDGVQSTGIEVAGGDGNVIRGNTCLNAFDPSGFTAPGISVNSATNCLVEGNTTNGTEEGIFVRNSDSIVVRGNTTTGSKSRYGIHVQGGSDDVVIEGNTVADGVSIGIRFADGANVQVRGNTSTGNGSAGISVSRATGVVVEDNVAVGNAIGIATGGTGDVVRANTARGNVIGFRTGGDGGRVEGNLSEDNQQSGFRYAATNTLFLDNISRRNGIGIRGENPSAESGRDNTFRGNEISENRGGGMWVTSGCTVEDNTISGSTFVSASSRGYGLILFGVDNLVEGNRIMGNAGSGVETGAGIANSGRHTIRGNEIRDNGDRGIRAAAGLGNVVEDNEISGNAGVGIDANHDVTIRNNTISENKGGISHTGANSTVMGNHLRANTLWGLRLLAGPHTVSGNTIEDTAGDGIVLLSAGNTLTRNVVTGATGVGITVGRLAQGNTIHDNRFDNAGTVTVDPASPPNTWNIPLTPGTNIVGGPLRGGNFWANTAGTGHSEVTPDANRDGIVDSPFVIDANNTDQYPLGGIPGLGVDPGSSHVTLWPPDHRMVEVTINVNATNDLTSIAVDVSSSEGENEHEPDRDVLETDPAAGTVRLNLRAERDGDGPGRTYTVTITVTDVFGQTATAAVTVTVPHDQDD